MLTFGAQLHRVARRPRAGLDRCRSPGERAEAARLVQDRLGLQRDHPAVGAHQELAPVRLGQSGPVPGVGAQAVLPGALPAARQPPPPRRPPPPALPHPTPPPPPPTPPPPLPPPPPPP